MQCPACQVDLLMTERQGIEIDYCPRCRGVWLDRGELDKIIDRSNVPPGMTPPATSPSMPPMAGDVPGGYYGDRRDERQGQHPGQHPGQYPGHYQKRKREGFLSDLFDWD